MTTETKAKLPIELVEAQQEVISAAIYIVRCHIPHPPLTGHETVDEMVRWGAIRHLHDVVAKMTQVEKALGEPE